MKFRPGFALAFVCAACASSAPQPATDPSLEEPSASPSPASAPASNADVEQGMSALEKQDFAGAKTILEQARAKDPKDAQAAF